MEVSNIEFIDGLHRGVHISFLAARVSPLFNSIISHHRESVSQRPLFPGLLTDSRFINKIDTTKLKADIKLTKPKFDPQKKSFIVKITH